MVLGLENTAPFYIGLWPGYDLAMICILKLMRSGYRRLSLSQNHFTAVPINNEQNKRKTRMTKVLSSLTLCIFFFFYFSLLFYFLVLIDRMRVMPGVWEVNFITTGVVVKIQVCHFWRAQLLDVSQYHN